MSSRHILFLLFLTALFSVVAAHSNECVYTLYIRTGSIIKAGTDSNISLTLGDVSGKSVWIRNIQDWGLMGPNYDYFERGNLDIFTGRGPCIPGPVCRLNLTSDGSGDHHGWYCDYVQVTSSGRHRSCSQSNFKVHQWLAKNVSPYQLTAMIDDCRVEDGGVRRHGKIPLVVRNKSSRVLSGSK